MLFNGTQLFFAMNHLALIVLIYFASNAILFVYERVKNTQNMLNQLNQRLKEIDDNILNC